MPDQFFVVIGTLMIFGGIILAFLAFVILVFRSGKFQARGGTVILIGPFPIVLGSDKKAAEALLLLAIVLVAFLVLLFVLQLLL